MRDAQVGDERARADFGTRELAVDVSGSVVEALLLDEIISRVAELFEFAVARMFVVLADRDALRSWNLLTDYHVIVALQRSSK